MNVFIWSQFEFQDQKSRIFADICRKFLASRQSCFLAGYDLFWLTTFQRYITTHLHEHNAKSRYQSTMTNQTELCIVRTANSPTEAQLLKNALAAVDIPAYINDANLLQANDFLTGAVGGVKLYVARFDLERARAILKEWDQGAFVLEGEEMDAPPTFKALERPVFSPEAAMLWSLILTPAFAFAIEIANLKLLRRKEGTLLAWAHLFVTLCMSAWVTLAAAQARLGLFAPFAASLALSAITIFSYFISGKRQSGFLISQYGLRYARRPLFSIALTVGISLAALAWLATLLWDF